jgi:hypothetical protein
MLRPLRGKKQKYGIETGKNPNERAASSLLRAGLPDRQTALNRNFMGFAGFTAEEYIHRVPATEAHR